MYSLLGYFLGPAVTDRRVKCFVHHSRDTKTFATRRVVVSQLLDNGTDRKCLELIADFQVAEPASAMEFYPPPERQYQKPNVTTQQLRDQYVKEGKIDKETGSLLDTMFALSGKFFDQIPAPEGVSGQNCMGFAKHLNTDQDHLHISDKFSAEWHRAKGSLPTTADQMASLAWAMDGGLSFIPLIHDHKYLEDVGACSSLDFSLRLFTNNFDFTKWHIKERKAIAGQGGRTYSEARLFDEHGQLVAMESQQSIMRPLPPGVKSKL
jgi:acyl-CoA thioesterase II